MLGCCYMAVSKSELEMAHPENVLNDSQWWYQETTCCMDIPGSVRVGDCSMYQTH
jgi:hypothetical protein